MNLEICQNWILFIYILSASIDAQKATLRESVEQILTQISPR